MEKTKGARVKEKACLEQIARVSLRPSREFNKKIREKPVGTSQFKEEFELS